MSASLTPIYGEAAPKSQTRDLPLMGEGTCHRTKEQQPDINSFKDKTLNTTVAISMEAGLLAGFPTDFISEAFMIKPTMPACLDPIYNIRISMDYYTGCAVCDISLEGIGELKEYQKNLRSYLGNDKANEAEHRSFPLRITKLSTRNCWKFHQGALPSWRLEDVSRRPFSNEPPATRKNYRYPFWECLY
ncbi:hypothetical protein ACFX13_031157 [Malus domestica]